MTGRPLNPRRAVLVVGATWAGLAAAGPGCATAVRAHPVAADQERGMLDLQAKNAGYVRRIEELENRIFILEDQLDSRKLADEQKAPATLPARVLRVGARRPGVAAPPGRVAPPLLVPVPSSAQPSEPEGAMAPEAARSLSAEATTESSIVAEHQVDYAGDAALGSTTPASPAARVGGRRPLLRLSADSRAQASSRDSSGGRGAPGGPAAAPEPRDAQFTVPSPERAAPEPLRLYREALQALRGGRPDLASAEFRRFLAANPGHDYADNAQYWIGECYYDQREYRAAERAFREVVERYPHGNKVPDAMLKLGFTLQWLGDEAGGRAVLESLARAFPKHEAARLASARLAHPEPPPGRAGGVSTLGTLLPVAPPGLRSPIAPPATSSVVSGNAAR